MRSNLITLFLSFFAISLIYAQDRVVSGKLTDTSGESLPGVNVLIKGKNQGVATDLDGGYTISGTDENTVLVYTFVGYENVEERIGNRKIINVSMSPIQLEEVVITGLSIEREKRSIGYGISEVSNDELTVSRSSNIVNALQGKTTGLIINQSSGNVGGSSQIIVRGITSLSGANNPLWIVDGVPIFNTQTVTGEENRITGNRDSFNGAAVVNPDDVATMTVLKGAAATALYGSRAAAGAILVTTKKGSKSSRAGKPQISINSTTRFDDLFRTPNMQYEYSGGGQGKYDSSSITSAFGAPILGQEVTKAVTDERVPLRAYKENYRNFYRLGKTLINNVAIADAGNKFDYRFSVTSLNQEGILPGANLDRLTIGLNAGAKHAKWLTTRFSVQYIQSDLKGTGVQGANDQNIIGWTTFTPTTDFRDFRTWKDTNGSQINQQNLTTNNPLWLRNENRNDRNDKRLIASMTQVITPLKNLNLTSRFGYDFEYDKRLITNSVGTITALTGTYIVDAIERRQINWDGLIDYTKEWGDFKVKGLVGFNYNSRTFTRETLQGSDIAVRGILNPSASKTTTPTRDFTDARLLGAYSQLDFNYKNWLSLSLTGRNDWSSTLPTQSNSYFYPSISAAFVFTDAFKIATKGLSFGKLRASWAQVGNTTDPYQLNFRFFPRARADGQYSLDLNFPFAGQLGLDKTFIVPNNTLVPEEQLSYEIGTELQFLDGRIGLDVAYFLSSNKNQIINQPIPESTGFQSQTINAGEVISSGIEISVNALVLDIGDFKWNMLINYSTNNVQVKNLGTNESLLPSSSGFSSVQVVAVNNGGIELKGIGWQRDPSTGRPLINPNTGRRIPTASPVSFGSVFPDASWGVTNQFSYKGFSLSVSIDGKIGGVIKSASVENLWNGGLTTETAKNRIGTFIDRDGVIQNDDGTVRDNDVPVRSTADLWANLNDRSITEHSVFDATFVKLREIGLFYSFPRKIIENTPFKGIRFGIEGRNLALIYAVIPHIDPEANLFGSGSAGFGVERNSIPSTRSIGFNIQLKF